MSYTTILAEIKTILEGISGIGTVHDYKRFSDNVTTLNNRAVSSSKFHVWFITRRAAPSTSSGSTQVFREHEFVLEGWYAIDDANASEKTFQALCDTIMDEFNSSTNILLNGTADNIRSPQLEEFTIEGETLAGVLCHKAIIIVYADEEVTC